MPFCVSAASVLVERRIEAIADIDEALHCIECLRLRRACQCLSKARRELVEANRRSEMRRAAA